MKKYTLFIICAVVAATFCSCNSSKSPVKTFVMPCSDCTKSDNSLRVWASGSSDNETTARKKAMTNASNDLAALLQKTVNSLTEQYTTSLTEGEASKSKTLFNEKSVIAAKQALTGATIICDQWKKDENGQYTNYIVLELKGKDFIEALTKEIGSESVDKKLLNDLFMKNIQESNK
ncbi:MAG: hypothetical protein IKJ95_03660 [Bacteroidaceae bacterium]|nr:hypothetical protein [Bacteroidaceae bacterium]